MVALWGGQGKTKQKCFPVFASLSLNKYFHYGLIYWHGWERCALGNRAADGWEISFNVYFPNRKTYRKKGRSYPWGERGDGRRQKAASETWFRNSELDERFSNGAKNKYWWKRFSHLPFNGSEGREKLRMSRKFGSSAIRNPFPKMSCSVWHFRRNEWQIA